MCQVVQEENPDKELRIYLEKVGERLVERVNGAGDIQDLEEGSGNEGRFCLLSVDRVDHQKVLKIPSVLEGFSLTFVKGCIVWKSYVVFSGFSTII